MKLIHVKYLDHVLFRDKKPGKMKPDVRETIGWLFKENEEFLVLLWDRPLNRGPQESEILSGGLVLLKSDILEVREVNG